MKFQPGDKVLLVHSNEEGEVVDIINKQMVNAHHLYAIERHHAF